MAEHTQSDIELVHSALRPLLMMLGDYRNLNPALLQRLTHMVSLFPTSFNEKMCDSLLVREGGREGGKEGEREGGREGGREGRRERGREGEVQ